MFNVKASTPSGMMSPSLTKLGRASARAEGTFSSSADDKVKEESNKKRKNELDRQ